MTTTNGSISPPPAPRPPAAAPGSGGNGCLRGCLITLGVVAALFVLTTVLALTAGRAYVVRHLPEWETRYPLLAVGIDLLSLREELTARKDLPPDGGRLEGSNDESLLPADVTLYPDPRAETYNISTDQVTAFQQVRAGRDEVAASLREDWTTNGWSLNDERTIEETVLFIWQKDARVCRLDLVTMSGDRPGTEIWLRCSAQSTQGE